MTTTPTPDPIPDPLAAVRKGQLRRTVLPHTPGVRCGAQSPRGYYCSRNEHPEHWQHIAAGSVKVHETWGGATDADA